MAIMIGEHALGAHNGVAEFAEVFDLFILMLEAEDLASVRDAAHRRRVTLHGAELPDRRRIVQVHLPLVYRVPHLGRGHWCTAHSRRPHRILRMHHVF